MEEQSVVSLPDLPRHLLLHILISPCLTAADLARLEASCYAFRAASEMVPYRFKPLPELAALQLCGTDPLFAALPHYHRSQLLNRFSGNWKLVLRFLHGVHQASGRVSTLSGGKIQVSAGVYHTLLTHGDGDLFSCGSSSSGVLGQGKENIQCSVLMHVPMRLPVVSVSASYQHAAIIVNTGQLFTFGDNSFSCCGHGETGGAIFKPTLVTALDGIACKQVATGLSYTVILTEVGQVYTCGANHYGQLGHGDMLSKDRPCLVERLSTLGPVVQVSTGVSHTLAVTQDGAVYSFGYGGNLCLGHGDLREDSLPRLIDVFRERNVFIIRVATGNKHSVALDSNGRVYTWGKGYCGGLGHGDENDRHIPEQVAHLTDIRAVQVCAYKRKTFVIDDRGQVFAFGWMACGSLGLVGRGNSEKIFNPQILETLKNYHVCQVSTGLYHTIVITDKGTMLAFGDNEKGQLGLEQYQCTVEPKKMCL